MKTHLIKFAAQSIKNLRGILAGLITTLLLFNVPPKVSSQTLPPLFWAGNAEALPANAGSGTWTTSTFSGSFAWSSSMTSPANGTWVQGSVAHFLGSGQPTPLVALDTNITAAGINFDSGANPFTIDTHGNPLTINGPGIVNTSLKTQTIDNSVQPIISGPLTVAGSTTFLSASTAGNAAIANAGATVTGGPGASTSFSNNSTAGSATITNNGSTVSGASGGTTTFGDTSSASGATITNGSRLAPNPSSNTDFGGSTQFNNSSTAGTATIINEGSAVSDPGFGGSTDFHQTSNAGSATITNNGGTVNGGAAALRNFSTTRMPPTRRSPTQAAQPLASAAVPQCSGRSGAARMLPVLQSPPAAERAEAEAD